MRRVAEERGVRVKSSGFVAISLGPLLGLSCVLLIYPHMAASESALGAKPAPAQSPVSPESVIVDVRSPSEFAARHIEGAVNIPLSRIAEAGLPKTKPIVLYCTGEGCPVSKDAARRLDAEGYTSVEVLEGGLLAWEAKGYPIVASKSAQSSKAAIVSRVSPRAVQRGLRNQDNLIIDVRPAPEFASTHIAGAFNLALEELLTKLPTLNKTRPIVVYDRLPARSQEAAQLLSANGFQVSELAGGISVWVAMKLPLEVSAK